MLGDQSMDLLKAADEALASIPLPPTAGQLPHGARPFQWEELDGRPTTTQSGGPAASGRAAVDLRIELGRTHIGRADAAKLRKGSLVPLDNAAGSPVDIYADGHLMARGETLALEGNFAVRVVEVLSSVNGS